MNDTLSTKETPTTPNGKPVDAATACSALRIPTRPRCHRCQRYITIDAHVDDDLWREVIGEHHGPGYICADCFTRAADERLIQWEGRLRLVPLSLASQMEIQTRVSSQNTKLIPNMENDTNNTAGSDCSAATCYAFEVASVQWEYEDELPDMEDVDYAHLFEKSEVRDGVRMFPYISIYSNSDGTETRHFLGA